MCASKVHDQPGMDFWVTIREHWFCTLGVHDFVRDAALGQLHLIGGACFAAASVPGVEGAVLCHRSDGVDFQKVHASDACHVVSRGVGCLSSLVPCPSLYHQGIPHLSKVTLSRCASLRHTSRTVGYVPASLELLTSELGRESEICPTITGIIRKS